MFGVFDDAGWWLGHGMAWQVLDAKPFDNYIDFPLSDAGVVIDFASTALLTLRSRAACEAPAQPNSPYRAPALRTSTAQLLSCRTELNA